MQKSGASATQMVFILAGGKSSRMGRDKASLLLGSRTFLERITIQARELGLPVITISEDDLPGRGPVGGIETAYKRFQFENALFLSCDSPLISTDLLRKILQHRRGKPLFVRDGGRAGFPFALPRNALGEIERLSDAGPCSLQDLSEHLKAAYLDLLESERWQLLNVNTPEDYRRAQRVWAETRKSDAVLEVRGLSIRRGKTELVASLSWKVSKGQHWVVLGANGCGKTSLFSSLLGYVTPTKGDIFVLGEEFGDSDWPALRKKVGLVSSTVRQLMAESEPAWITVASGKYAVIDFWGTPKPKDKSQALELLRLTECEYLAERPWAVLSQGERQRVLIGRALMTDPALLILDEPCAGLDPAAREHFLQFLERLGRKSNAPSIVLVTHHVEEVVPVFTHALLLKAGEKLAEGPVAKMLTSERLTDTFGTKMQVRRAGDRYSLRVTLEAKVII